MTARSPFGRRTLAAATSAILLAGFGVALTPAAAQPAAPAAPAAPASRGTARAAHTFGHHRIDVSKTKLGALDHAQSGRRTVFVQLAGQGAAAVSARVLRTGTGTAAAKRGEARSAALARRAQVSSTSAAVFGAAKASDAQATELFRVSNALPGLAINASIAALRALAARTDVVKITAIVPKHPTNSSAAQLTKVLNTWTSLGVTGTGVTVGVIDTGLDYTHADFGGPGTVPAWTAAHAAETAPGWLAALPALAQAKIAGGHDFVGDTYNADVPAHSTPIPDTNPIDCNEHGTHVSGTVAGYGVTAGGATFTGSYGALTGPALDAMKIGPGMAPNAELYPMKVFGCQGSTDVVIPALDWSLDPNQDGIFTDHLDVVNLSLGSDYTPVDDPENDVVDAVAAQGVLPVIAMGNNGDLTDTGGSPGNAVRSLAVASTVDALQLRDGLHINTPTGVVPSNIAAGQNSQAYDWIAHPATVTGDVVAVSNPANLDGCDAIADNLTGKVVWLEWDDNDATRRCGSVQRSGNAFAAGAKGAIFTSTLNVFGAGITGSANIPVFQMPKTATDALRPGLVAHTLNVTFDGALAHTIADRNPAIEDTISSFTSRGPHGSIGAVKPDVAAPGDTIASAGMGTGNDVLVISGTSMATPHTAGIAALVRAEHPTWTVEQAKAAIMNTAGHDLFDGLNKTGHKYGPARVGAGRVDAEAAVSTQVLAYNIDLHGAVSTTFGVVEAPITQATITRTRSIEVENAGASSATLNLSYDAVVSQPGVSYAVTPASMTLAGHASGVATVTMTVHPAALRKTIDPTMQLNQDIGGLVPRQYVSDASGRVLISQASHADLRVPVYGAAKPVSDLTASSTTVGTSAGLQLSGHGFNQGPAVPDTTTFTSAVSVMDFGAASPQLPVCAPAAPINNCTPNQSATGGDIQYVGAGSIISNDGDPTNDIMWTGVSTYGNSATLGNTLIPYVQYDTNVDGTPDFETDVQNVPGSDVLLATTYDLSLAPGTNVVDEEPVNFNFGDVDTNTFDSNVLLIPVWPQALGVAPSASTFPITYKVGTFSIYGSASNFGDIDDVGPVSFDVAKPAVGVTDPLWIDAGGATIATHTTVTNTPALVLHLHNASGTRAQKVLLRAPSAASMSAPKAITYSKSASIGTHLVNQFTAGGIAHAPVSLYARTSSAHPWVKVRSAITGSNAVAWTTVTPKTKTQYQWRYAGDGTHAPTASAIATVSVNQAVSAFAAPSRVKHGKSFALYGRVAPAKSGEQVRLQQSVHGAWHTIASTTVRKQRLPDGSTAWGYVFTRGTAVAGVRLYRTVVSAYGGLSAGSSRTVTVTVT